MSFRQELDARDYGVIADDGADQSTAIQALLDAAKTLGLPVRFPAGTFRVDTTVTYNTSGDDVKPLRLLGMGANSTIFDARVANGPAISIDGSGTSNQRARHVEIGNLRIKTTTTPTGTRPARRLPAPPHARLVASSRTVWQRQGPPPRLS